MIMDVDELIKRMGIADAAVTDEMRAQYGLWMAGVWRAFQDWCKWKIELTSGHVEYYDGNGTGLLPLRTPYTLDNATLDVRVDQTGYYGHGSSAFAASTELTLGTDFVLRLEGGTYAKSGMLVKLPGASVTSFNWPSDALFNRGRSGLAWRQGPYWPVGTGNIKVTCDFGFSKANMPESLKIAMAGAVAIVRNFVQKGLFVTGENLGDYSWSGQLINNTEFATVQSYLKQYRDTQI